MRILSFLGLMTLLAGCQSTTFGNSAPYSYFQSQHPDIVMPANAPSVTQQYRKLPDDGATHAPEGDHLGFDVIGDVGTPVLAAADGTVQRSYSEPMYGNQVVLVHGDDANGVRWTTIYKHLNARSAKEGDRIRRGQQIGLLGQTGLLAQGYPHLHFEVWTKAKGDVPQPVDGQYYWVGGPGKVTCFTSGRRFPAAPDKLTYPVVCKGR